MIGNILKASGYVLLARQAADFLTTSQRYREREQNRKQVACSISGSLFGLAVGFGVGLLFAPRSGRETREMLTESACSQFERLQSGISESSRHVGDMFSKKDEMFCVETPQHEVEEVARQS